MKYSILYFICICLFACSGTKKISEVSANDQIQTGSFPDAGIDATLISRMDSQVVNGTYPNIHSILISRKNKLVFEKYYPGKDQNWGKDLGFITHHSDSLHDIRSISKSIVSACFGVAMAQGKIKSVDQKVFDFFPEYKYLDTGMKSQLTVKHLLTMSTGQVWNEDVPYTDPNNSEIRMIRSANPIEFVLNQPLEMAPGQKWKYNGGSTQLLASIIERTTGKKADAFANEYLFKPLGIKRYEWNRYPGTDLPAAASGLRLTSRDLLKFGLLYLDGGNYNGKQILSPEWVKESFQYHINRPTRPGSTRNGYGYQFFLLSRPVGNRIAGGALAVGNGEQRIFIDNENELVVVVTAGNYNLWDIKNNTDALVFNFVYPALK